MFEKKNPNIILRTFIQKYSSVEFFKDVINISLFPSDFNVSVGDSQGNSVSEYIIKFLDNLSGTVQRIAPDIKPIVDQNILLSKTLLRIREAGRGLVTYDTVFQHISANNAAVKRIISDVIENRLNNPDSFRLKIDEIVNKIDYYYDMQLAINGMTKIHDFIESMESPDTSIIDAVSKYKEMCLESYNDLSKLSALSKDESATDYYVISDKDSISTIAKDVTEYITTGYSFFKTGFDVFDTSVEGLESSSVHLIAAPSNHGKSVVLANLYYSIIKTNLSEFDENDAAIFITLEDDISKVLRKFICIFGNYDFPVVKKLYTLSYEILKAKKKQGKYTGKEDLILKSRIEDLIKSLIEKAILTITKGKVRLLLKHCNENTYSPGDIARYIEKLKVQNINVKFVAIDYLDVLSPTIKQSYFQERDVLGQITQECRNLSRIYSIPVLLPTQNQKDSENVAQAMSNTKIGESYKKIRYSDFVYNCRMRDDLSLFDDEVKGYVFREDSSIKDTSPEIISIKDELINVMIPLEIKITKSKELGKGMYRYVLFCKRNVKIYNYVDEYLEDSREINRNTAALELALDELTNLAVTSVSTNDFESPTDDNYF